MRISSLFYKAHYPGLDPDAKNYAPLRGPANTVPALAQSGAAHVRHHAGSLQKELLAKMASQTTLAYLERLEAWVTASEPGEKRREAADKIRAWMDLRSGRTPSTVDALMRLAEMDDSLDLGELDLKHEPPLPDGARKVDLSYNKLSRLEQPQPDSLEILLADHNAITEVTAPLSKNLEFVDFGANKLQRLPEQLSDCERLRVLRAYENELREIPDLRRTRIEEINIAKNHVRALRNLPDTTRIVSSNNNELLDVELPDSVEHAYLYDNHLALPPKVPGNIRHWNIHRNPLLELGLPEHPPSNLKGLYVDPAQVRAGMVPENYRHVMRVITDDA